MDRLSALMLRASLVWLATGAVLGGIMLNDRLIPGAWTSAFLPAHVHMLLVGWLLQFALAVAIWLLPRRRSPQRPLGYDERPVAAAAIAVNVGLVLRIVAEPLERLGRASAWTSAALAVSGVLQVAAILLFVAHLWPRAGPRKPTPPAAKAAEAPNP